MPIRVPAVWTYEVDWDGHGYTLYHQDRARYFRYEDTDRVWDEHDAWNMAEFDAEYRKTKLYLNSLSSFELDNPTPDLISLQKRFRSIKKQRFTSPGRKSKS